eukprot:Skav233249  [mRNA]  locus=scaffold2371:15358:21333:- [translate_table: standard]
MSTNRVNLECDEDVNASWVAADACGTARNAPSSAAELRDEPRMLTVGRWGKPCNSGCLTTRCGVFLPLPLRLRGSRFVSERRVVEQQGTGEKQALAGHFCGIMDFSQSAEELLTKLDTYREQLAQVEEALEQQPDEPSLVKLKNDLTEVIVLTEDLVKYQAAAPTEAEQAEGVATANTTGRASVVPQHLGRDAGCVVFSTASQFPQGSWIHK